METKHIGDFVQGQKINIVLKTPETATAEERKVFADNDLYIGIYGSVKKMLSTKDGSILKTVGADGSVMMSCSLSASDTKGMLGRYEAEILVKNTNSSFTSPCRNVVCFDVKRRRISEVV